MQNRRDRWSLEGMRRFTRSVRRKVIRRTWRPPWGTGTAPSRLTRTQELFCLWNAERLRISPAESQRRYVDSWKSIRGGHKGDEFVWFSNLSYQIFRVLYADLPGELIATYQFYGPLHFLRMLSYDEPKWDDKHPLVAHLPERSRIRILDFGCGLAPGSRSLADKLRERGCDVDLFLADIPTVRKPFLLWMGERTGFPPVFIDCTEQVPIPALPPCDVCVATNVFEHLVQPLEHLDAFDRALQPGGLLWTDIADHRPEFMHVTPSLQVLRERLEQLGYETIVPNHVYRKRS